MSVLAMDLGRLRGLILINLGLLALFLLFLLPEHSYIRAANYRAGLLLMATVCNLPLKLVLLLIASLGTLRFWSDRCVAPCGYLALLVIVLFATQFIVAFFV